MCSGSHEVIIPGLNDTSVFLPNLTYWAEQHITNIFQAAPLSAAFNATFDEFIGQNASITVNGVNTTREDYKQQFTGGNFSVTFVGTVEFPSAETMFELNDVVGTFFMANDQNATASNSSWSDILTSSLNIIVSEDKSVNTDHQHGQGGVVDPRRVTVVNQIITDGSNSNSTRTS